MKGKSFLGLAPWLERPKLGSERAGLISHLWQAPYHGELSLWIPYHDGGGGRRVVRWASSTFVFFALGHNDFK